MCSIFTPFSSVAVSVVVHIVDEVFRSLASVLLMFCVCLRLPFVAILSLKLTLFVAFNVTVRFCAYLRCTNKHKRTNNTYRPTELSEAHVQHDRTNRCNVPEKRNSARNVL